MAHTALNNEKALLLRIAAGDQLAFGVLVKEYWNTIYSHAIAYLKSVELAEEATQDIFMRVWKARETLGTVRSLKDYLFIIARNYIFNAARKKIEQLYILPGNWETSSASPVQQAEFRETNQLLLQGVELLPEKRRLVFKMSRFEGMSNEQIAAALDMHKDTVYQYLVKATTFLKLYLREHNDQSILVIILLSGIQ